MSYSKNMKLPDKPFPVYWKKGKCNCCGDTDISVRTVEFHDANGNSYIDWRCQDCYNKLTDYIKEKYDLPYTKFLDKYNSSKSKSILGKF